MAYAQMTCVFSVCLPRGRIDSVIRQWVGFLGICFLARVWLHHDCICRPCAWAK